MKTLDILDAPEIQNPHGVSVRRLHDSEHLQAMLVSLQPGERLKLHATPVDVLFFPVEGRGIVEIGGEQQEVAAGTLVESRARIPHRLLNEGKEVFRCLVLKTPRPSETARLL